MPDQDPNQPPPKPPLLIQVSKNFESAFISGAGGFAFPVYVQRQNQQGVTERIQTTPAQLIENLTAALLTHAAYLEQHGNLLQEEIEIAQTQLEADEEQEGEQIAEEFHAGNTRRKPRAPR